MRKILTLICLIPALLIPLLSQAKSSGEELAFVPNQGQLTDTEGKLRPDILYTASFQGLDIYVQKTGISYVWSQAANPEMDQFGQVSTEARLEAAAQPRKFHRVDVSWLDANPNAQYQVGSQLPGKYNYYLEHCPQGILNVSRHGELIAKDIYPNIDLVLRGSASGLKYDFVVHPGGDPAQVRFSYNGEDRLELNPDGTIRIETSLGHMIEAAPLSLQAGQEIASTYSLNTGDHSFGFAFPEGWDAHRDLVIDPDLFWVTLYGGTGKENNELFGDVITDSENNVYFSGHSTDGSFPTSPGAYQTTFGAGGNDITLTKFDAAGNLIWSTFYGSTGYDLGSGIDVDKNDNIYLTGTTNSSAFPATIGSFSGISDGVLLKMDKNGQRVFTRFVGGNFFEEAYRVKVNDAGESYLTGHTESTDFPTTPGAYQPSIGGLKDGYIVKISADGSTILWSTYLGGTLSDFVTGVCIDPNGDVMLSGYAESTNFPVMGSPFQATHAGGTFDLFISKWSATGVPYWITYYGGGGSDNNVACACDASGNVWLTGNTASSTNFPVSGNALQPTYGASLFTAYLIAMNSNGGQHYGSYFGGSTWQKGIDLSIGTFGDIYLTGDTRSSNFPVTGDAAQSTFGGASADAFLTKFDPSGTSILYSTYWGGSGDDFGRGIHANHLNGDIAIVGYTGSTSFPLIGNNHQSVFGGGTSDAFLLYFKDCGDVSPLIGGGDTTWYCAGNFATLDAGPGMLSYSWSTGDNTRNIGVNSPGFYSVTIVDADSCTGSSTTLVLPSQFPTANATLTGNSTICDGESATLTASGGAFYQWSLNNVEIPGATSATYGATQAGDYTVRVSNPGDCADSTDANPITITVLPSPAPNLGGDTAVCAGTSLTLNPGGPFTSYTWSDASTSPTLSVNSTGSYSVAVSGSNGCTVSDTVQVTFNAPTASFTYSSNGMTGLFTSTSVGATSYRWEFGDGGLAFTPNPPHTYPMEGTYYVCLIASDAIGCQDTFCDSVSIFATAAEAGLLAFNSLDLYPNPSAGNVTLDMVLPAEQSIQARIINSMGQVVWEENWNLFVGENQKQLNLKNLPAGVYYLDLVTEKEGSVES